MAKVDRKPEARKKEIEEVKKEETKKQMYGGQEVAPRFGNAKEIPVNEPNKVR